MEGARWSGGLCGRKWSPAPSAVVRSREQAIRAAGKSEIGEIGEKAEKLERACHKSKYSIVFDVCEVYSSQVLFRQCKSTRENEKCLYEVQDETGVGKSEVK